METNQPISKTQVWTGRILSGLAVLFFLMDGVMKLLKPAPVVEATVHLGYPESDIVGIGVLLLSCTLLYIVPRTSVLGAILLTGYLGGAVASQIRINAGGFSEVFPVIMAALMWTGLWLRDVRVRRLVAQ